jgi:predicted GNAT family acetyltransferase
VSSHPLDRPVWESLVTHHRPLALGGELARRFQRDVNLFASARDDGKDAQEALSALVGTGESIYILQVPPISVPPDLRATHRALGVQMAAAKDFAPADDDRILALGDEDAPEMVALATLTKPGPFLKNTHRMGDFLGVRIDGRLAAMAGERTRFPDFTEVSGVCTHPDFRGLGLARLLSLAVSAKIAARGETPFLHAWKTNAAAIGLYESLGFRHRADVDVAVLAKA